MRCLRCNNDYNEVYQTCPYCGTPRYNDTQPIMPQKKKSNGGLIALLIVIIIFIVGVTVAACMLLMQPKNTVTVSADSQFGEQLSLGEKYLSEENYDEAIIAFKKAIDIRPNEPEPYLKLADVYVEKNDYQNALSTLEDGYAKTNDTAIATRLEEIKSVITYNTLIKEGEEALSDKNYDTAVSKFEEAIKLRNDEVQPYLSASEAYLGKKDTDGAKKILEQGYEKTHSAEIKEKLDSLPSMEKAYLSVVEDLINQYGEGKVIDDTIFKTRYQADGLFFVRLLDFDGDGQDELLCSYLKSKFLGNTSLYEFDGEKANLIYEKHNISYGAEGERHVEYVEENGKIILLTKKNHQTFCIEEWSELKNSEMTIVKTYSDSPNEEERKNGYYNVYRIDNTIVDENTFNAEREEFFKNRFHIQLDRNDKEVLTTVLDETNETLKKLGYAKTETSVTVDNTNWKTLYKEKIAEEKNKSGSTNDDMYRFDLYDVDNDSIPKLFLSRGTAHADYCMVYTIINNEVADLKIGGQYGTVSANAEKNLICASGHTNQVGRVWTAFYEKRGDVCNRLKFYEAYPSTKYLIDEQEVSEEEYKNSIAEYNSLNWYSLGRRYKSDKNTINQTIDDWTKNVEPTDTYYN